MIASSYQSVTTVALICVVAFRTAPPVGGLSCFVYKVTIELITVIQKLPLDTYNKKPTIRWD